MSRILGIDPGSRSTGYGLIEQSETGIDYVASGVIRTQHEGYPARLKEIYSGIDLVVAEYAPDECALEEVFVAHNPSSALKLGQARGAALVAVMSHEVAVSEYAARRVKSMIVGTGKATKDQVKYMVKALLHLDGRLSQDASDALAIAICHAFSKKTDDWTIGR
ncbi:MAG: crossover junction endodeoxyribonuclease RuvC [Gammaproteobacteria bacterium]|nr:crossover junction endodeoxyribonuclease RuvC [Gammaproteobacteria bacterium]